jgi:hypothetical protein
MTRARLALRRPRLSVRLVILAAAGGATGGVLGILAGLLSAPVTADAPGALQTARGAGRVR